MVFGTRCRVGLAAVLLALTGCAPKPAGHGMPRGVVFVRDRYHSSPISRDPEHSRVYRDGKLVARITGRVFAARDSAAGSLVYDDRTKTARLFAGGPSWKFDPCPDRNGIPDLALSPDGRRGVCGFISSDGRRLVVFDTRSPARMARVIFRNLSYNRAYRAAWVDNERIALVEHRDGCRFYAHYGDAPAGLVIIDVRGHVLERGPCMAGVATGPNRLIYVDYSDNWKRFFDPLGDQPRDLIAFRLEPGGAWQDGLVQFVDGEGHAFSTGADFRDGTLRDESGTALVTDVRSAAWAKP